MMMARRHDDVAPKGRLQGVYQGRIIEDLGKVPSLEDVPRQVDFIFSCPPYYDLERYSDDPRDLSYKPTYASFLKSYRAVIKLSLERLRPDHFACFVVGEIRDDKGLMRNFVGDTIAAFADGGARLYNSLIMLMPLNSLPMRVKASFDATAKVGNCHQHVLVFYKGRRPNEDVEKLRLHNAKRPMEWE